jgi:outer membrane protein
MRPSIAVRALLSVSWLATVSQAQVASNQPAAQHIVTLSFNSAVLETAEAQRELAALQAKLAPRQAQLQSLNNEGEALRKQLTDAGDKLSDTERATRERSLETKEKELQRQAEDFRTDSQNESQLVFQKVAQKVYAFFADVFPAAWILRSY